MYENGKESESGLLKPTLTPTPPPNNWLLPNLTPDSPALLECLFRKKFLCDWIFVSLHSIRFMKYVTSCVKVVI